MGVHVIGTQVGCVQRVLTAACGNRVGESQTKLYIYRPENQTNKLKYTKDFPQSKVCL